MPDSLAALLATGPAVASAADDASWYGTANVGANLLAPPDGTVNTIDDLVAKLQEFAKGPDVGRTGWIFGLGYDDALLGRHPTRDDLDKVSKDVPVIAVHISGHFSAMNSAGLAKVGYTAATKDPEGGVSRRREGSTEPNGVLEELASIPKMTPAINAQKPEDKDYFLAKGLELAKSFGYTTTNEGRAFGFQHADLVDAAKRGLLDGQRRAQRRWFRQRTGDGHGHVSRTNRAAAGRHRQGSARRRVAGRCAGRRARPAVD